MAAEDASHLLARHSNSPAPVPSAHASEDPPSRSVVTEAASPTAHASLASTGTERSMYPMPGPLASQPRAQSQSASQAPSQSQNQSQSQGFGAARSPSVNMDGQAVHPLADTAASGSAPTSSSPVASSPAVPAAPPAPASHRSPASPAMYHPKHPQQPQQQQQQQEDPSQQPTHSSASTNGYRPLNVKDALTYLDQVKIQFSEQPEIYNRFLDIMKDFKSQTIDTPGVIERVSSLFHGHSSLISGFNTFLPPGYRIECYADERGRDVIKVTTPTGTTTTSGAEPLNLMPSTAPGGYYASYAQQPPSQQQHHQHQRYGRPMPPQNVYHRPSMPQREDAGGRRAPVEFNHAINYVNKIKNRFAGEPDTYKQFLEILQTYQKEQKPIQEVYAQVQDLFNGAADLLDEFKQFLPETSGAGGGAGMAALFGGVTGKRGSVMVPSLPPSTSSRKKRIGSISSANLSKRSKIHHKMEVQLSNVRSGMDDTDFETSARATMSAEEAEFFDRVQKYIGHRGTYRAFLKLLNLFSRQILDQNLLVARVESFIGGNHELFDWFKRLVGYNPKDDTIIENEPTEKPNLANCKPYGPSYRCIPEKWQQETCSGRDNLCREVLNDEYVSHPRWASEENSYVTSKKNHFEEALHRVEEERYDYDLSIEANLNTIALLEPVVKKISVMSEEEKIEYQLPPGLGGPSKAIYQHIIKKIYGNDRGREVIDLIHNNPVPTVPLLLKRLKQKDDEWKRAQREWNKIWREVEAKNYYKALDYQGVTFKNNDKKIMSSKHMLAEIENIRNSQADQVKRKQPSKEKFVYDGGSRHPPQFSFEFNDRHVFHDITRLIISFLERQEVYNPEHCDALRAFLDTFIPLLFDVDGDVLMGDVRIKTEEGDDAPEEQRKERPSITFFGNSTYYCFMRLYQMAYNRLQTLKNVDNDYKDHPDKTKKANKAALDLSLTNVTVNGVGMDFSNGYYNAMLDLIDVFFESAVDQQVYEECARYIYGKKAYVIFTIDKLVMLLIRHLHQIMSDASTRQLVDLFKMFRDLENPPNTQQLATYKMRAEQEYLEPNESIFAFVFDLGKRVLTIQLLGTDDYVLETDARVAYNEYVTNYADFNIPTEGVKQDRMQKRFMKRNLKEEGEKDEKNADDDSYVYQGMQYKISKDTYHMFYIIDTEDAFLRKRPAQRAKLGMRQQPRWHEWLESEKGWQGAIEDKAAAEQEARRSLGESS